MTSALVLTPLLLVGLLIALFVPVLAKLLRRCPVQEITSDWLESFDVTVYYPMQELLNDEDFAFLSRQPGFDLSLYRKLRRDRLHIFKQYLNRAIGDFNRLYSAIRVAIVQSPEDRSDLLSTLIWLRLRFFCSVLKAQLSYQLCLVGFHSLAVHSLILQLEEMNTRLTLVVAGSSI